MRILLANSYFLERDLNEQKIMKPYPPLGILYLAGALKEAGHDISIFDGTFSKPTDFSRQVAAAKPDLVGIHANVITRETSLDLTRQVVEQGFPVVLGGPDPTGDGAAYLKAGAMAVVRGEGERTLTELVSHLEEDDFKADLNRISGLMIPNGDAPLVTKERERIEDLDALPLPDRSGIDMERYLQAWKNRHGYSSVSLITSRGCPYKCTWCSKEIFGAKFRQSSPERVIEEIKQLQELYQPDQLWFADDVLCLNRKWILQMTQMMVEQQLTIPFECLARVDRVDQEVVQSLKKAGCFRVWFGAESGSDKVVQSMKKDFTVPQIKASVKMTMQTGVQAGLFILIGYPGERLIDFLKTLKMIRELGPDYCGGSVAFPIKGTPFYDDVRHLLSEDYTWSSRNENRLSFRGYPALFYWFAVRLLHNWSQLFSVRTRKDPIPKRLVRAAKVVVAGAGTICVGFLYELKQKFSSSSEAAQSKETVS